MTYNIFSHEGVQGDLVNTFYRLLMSGKEVSYKDVLEEYYGESINHNASNDDLYGTMKKVVPKVVKAFEENGYLVVPIPEGRSTNYQYIGKEKDPLGKFRFRALVEERYTKLTNFIIRKTPCRFEYKPFDRAKKDLVFHPHIMMKYNDRLFAIGISETEGKEPFRRYVVALDRIEGEIRKASSSHVYKPALADEYCYLSHMVGVTLEEGAQLTTITLRVHDKYTFGRLKTKPMHDSQRVICTPNYEEGREYGDFELSVYPNKELIGKILSYGSMLEVVVPESVRQRVAEEVEEMSKRYKKE